MIMGTTIKGFLGSAYEPTIGSNNYKWWLKLAMIDYMMIQDCSYCS